MYPLERELVQRHAGKPFALLGVNCDELPRLRRVLDSQAVTWRNWADGPGGPIAEQWRVDSFPTLFVLDHEGVIRHKNVRGAELEQAVADLLARVPPAQSASTTTAPPAANPASPPAQAADVVAQPALRTWTSKDGRKVQLEFLELHGDQLKVRRADGKEFDVPLDRFIEADQQWARQRAAPTP